MPVTSYTEVIEITLIGTMLGQETRNVFYYGTTDPLGSVSNILNEFNTQVVGALLPCVCDNWKAVNAIGQQVLGGAAFGSIIINAFGTVTGDALPPFVSWDFTMVRGGARERNGYKRFAGVPESRQQNGTASPTALTLLTTLGTQLNAPLTVTMGPVLYPVIKRTAINRVPVHPAQYWDVSDVIYSKIGSQNSRKFGHGR